MNSRSEGFTLVELLVSLLIGAIVLGAVYQTLTTQERTNRHQLAIVSTEQNTRTALSVITSDLREVSATDGDVVFADSVSIRYRALRKAALVCDKDFTSNGWVNVATLGDDFVVGDSVLMFQEGPSKTSAQDDSWAVSVVTGTSGNACPGNPIGGIRRLDFPAGAVASVDSGGLFRSFAQVGYRLVNTGTGGTLFRIEGGDSVAIVEGLAPISAGGIRFRYFNAAGTQINPTTAALRRTIMRIEVKVTGMAAGGATGTGRMFTDSLSGQVFLRGNRKTS